MQASRAPQRLANALEALVSWSFHIAEYRKRYHANRKVYFALKTLRDVIDWNMKQFDEEAKKDEQW
jgi:hypothetical protein